MRSAVLLSAIAFGSLLAQADAQQGCPTCSQPDCCSHCGCGQCSKKVCRLKCEMRPVTTFRYECKCEDFCVPGPSKYCGKCKVPDCNARCGYRTETKWQPTCGCVRTRKLLVKVPVTKQVPTYTCEVVNICGGCGHAQIDEAATAEARAKEIIPTSADMPLVFEMGGAAELTPATPAERQTAETAAKGTFFGRIFGR